jgi:hypothetical protein
VTVIVAVAVTLTVTLTGKAYVSKALYVFDKLILIICG